MNADLVRLERRQARRRRLTLLAERRMALAVRAGSVPANGSTAPAAARRATDATAAPVGATPDAAG